MRSSEKLRQSEGNAIHSVYQALWRQKPVGLEERQYSDEQWKINCSFNMLQIVKDCKFLDTNGMTIKEYPPVMLATLTKPRSSKPTTALSKGFRKHRCLMVYTTQYCHTMKRTTFHHEAVVTSAGRNQGWRHHRPRWDRHARTKSKSSESPLLRLWRTSCDKLQGSLWQIFSMFVSVVLLLWSPRGLRRNVTQLRALKKPCQAEGFWIFIYQRDADSYLGRAPEPFFAGGKMRNLERLKWWEDYAAKDSRQGGKTPRVSHRK